MNCDDIISPQREMKNMNRHTSQGFLPPYDNNGYDKRRSFGGGGEGSVYLGIPNQGKESSSNYYDYFKTQEPRQNILII